MTPFTTSTENDKVLAAFHAALAAGLKVAKSETADTGKYSYQYQDFNVVLHAVRDALAANGAVLSQIPHGGEGDVWGLSTMILHESGQWMSFAPYTRPLLRDEQGHGSALTYGKRYALAAIFAIATADDDGAEATRQQRNQQQYDGSRTPEELSIRTIIKLQSPENRALLIEDFKKAHGMKALADMPEWQHPAALSWVLNWVSLDETDGQTYATDEPQDHQSPGSKGP